MILVYLLFITMIMYQLTVNYYLQHNCSIKFTSFQVFGDIEGQSQIFPIFGISYFTRI